MTLVGCVCANGSWIPPYIIFKGSRWNDDYKRDCLPNTQVRLSEKGWITKKPNKRNFHTIFKMPFIKALSEKNIKNAFKSCGIVPFDRNAIPREKLAPSLLTERLDPQEDRGAPDASRSSTGSVQEDGTETPQLSATKLSPVDSILRTPAGNVRRKPTRARSVDTKAKLLSGNEPRPLALSSSRRRKGSVVLDSAGPSGTRKSKVRNEKKENISSDGDWTCGTCGGQYSTDERERNGKKWVQCSFCLIPYHELCQSECAVGHIYMCDLCSLTK